MPVSPARRRLGGAARRLLATLVSALFLLPLLWAAAASLRAPGVPPRRLELLPRSPAWGNYRAVFDVVDLGRALANSLLVAAGVVPLTILCASLAGFAIAQAPRPWQGRLLLLSVLCLMVPLTAIWLPRFVLVEQLGLMNRRLALLLPALMGTSPLYVLLFAWSFLRVPREVYEAARLDGAGPYRIWAQIGLPLARPAAVAVGVLAFVHAWNSFVEPLLYLRTPDKATASLALRVLYGLDRTQTPLVLAGAVVVTAPVVLVFLLAQRAFLQDRGGRGVLGR